MNNAEIITKVSNIFIMLLSSISRDDINRVKAYISDDLYNHYNDVIKSNIKNNVKQKYGEMNVATINIISNNGSELVADVTAKYMDYKIDRATKKIVSGTDTRRDVYNYRLIFRINNEADERFVYKCPNCGANLNIHNTSVCPYCNKPLDYRFSPLILEKINIF